ncbi:unnamed protein product, partial [Mesorhabditis belari]|uniref:ATP-dependent RNA helicase n=1 Tax=Mesorhabditis belari TaxID=2138241 RepID=A0AAF3EN46_9BILA
MDKRGTDMMDELLRQCSHGIVELTKLKDLTISNPRNAFQIERIDNKGDTMPPVGMASQQPEMSTLVHPQEMQRKALQSFEDLCAVSHPIQQFLEEIHPNRKDKQEPFKPWPVQSYVYPFLKERQHVLVRSPTGSGKTIAFLAPILDAILVEGRDRVKKPRALIIADTKDLLVQHYQNALKINEFLDAGNQNITIGCHIGGVHLARLPRYEYLKSFQSDILFMSPGKMMEALQKKMLDLSHLMYIVFDEADEMFHCGKFLIELREFQKALQECRETVPTFAPTFSMFSATLVFKSPEVERGLEVFFGVEWPQIVEKIGYVVVQFPTLIQQNVIQVDDFPQKLLVLEQLLDRDLYRMGRSREDTDKASKTYSNTTLVFCDTRKQVYNLAAWLTQKGFYLKIHTGRMPEDIKRKNMRMITDRRLPLLISSNVMARGLDKPSINHVIMFELPTQNWSTYSHRVGRTGRCGEEGNCTVLLNKNGGKELQQAPQLLRTLMVYRQKIPKWLFERFGHVALQGIDHYIAPQSQKLAENLVMQMNDPQANFNESLISSDTSLVFSSTDETQHSQSAHPYFGEQQEMEAAEIIRRQEVYVESHRSMHPNPGEQRAMVDVEVGRRLAALAGSRPTLCDGLDSDDDDAPDRYEDDESSND